MRVGIDIDGVVIDFVEAFIQTVREEQIHLCYEEIFCYDFSQVLGIPKPETWRLIEKTIRRNKFNLIQGAREGIERLKRTGHEIILVTGRPRAFLSDTTRVLGEHGIIYDKLIFEEFLKKGEYEDFDVFIEDNLEEAIQLAELQTPVLLYVHPWNRGTLNARNLLILVRNWQEITDRVEQLSELPFNRRV